MDVIDVEQRTSARGGIPTRGRHDESKGSTGDSDIATLSWHSWSDFEVAAEELTPSGQVCRFGGAVDVGMTADAVLFPKWDGGKAHFRVLDSGLKAWARQGQGRLDDMHLTFLGQSIFTAPVTDLSTATFHQEAPIWDRDFTLAEFAIPVFGLALKVRIGVPVAAGYKADAATAIQRGCDVKNASFSVSGAFEPWAKVGTEASVSVSAFLAEAGAEVELTLLDARLPSRAKLSLSSPNLSQVYFVFDTDTSLKIRTLDGSLSFYAKVLGAEVGRWTPIEWKGFGFNVPIYVDSRQVPVIDISNALTLR